MKSFEYAHPQTEAEAVDLLADHQGNTAVLAGGTDLISLLKAELLTPNRVVDLKQIESLRTVTPHEGGLLVGSLLTLEELQQEAQLADYRSLLDAAENVKAIQMQQQGTLGGDLCLLPNCWYFRNGYGLLAHDGRSSLSEQGDNRYHAILGNRGPAKFVSASRLAPSLMAWGAKVRIVGPVPDVDTMIPLENFYTTPKTPKQNVTVLQPGQFISHVWLPNSARTLSATYDVLELNGLDWPLASASATLAISGGRVAAARVVMGHVAPTPWNSREAARVLTGQPLTPEIAEAAADAALTSATPLKDNGYKVRLARTAVKRAILKAAGLLNLEGEI